MKASCIDLCLSIVSVCRRTPGSHRHDEHLDSAERHSSGHGHQKRLPLAAKAGQILEDGDAVRSALVLISRGVSVHVHPTFATIRICAPFVFFYGHAGHFFYFFLFRSFLWHIPLTYKTDASDAVHRHLMTTRTGISDDV